MKLDRCRGFAYDEKGAVFVEFAIAILAIAALLVAGTSVGGYCVGRFAAERATSAVAEVASLEAPGAVAARPVVFEQIFRDVSGLSSEQSFEIFVEEWTFDASGTPQLVEPSAYGTLAEPQTVVAGTAPTTFDGLTLSAGDRLFVVETWSLPLSQGFNALSFQPIHCQRILRARVHS